MNIQSTYTACLDYLIVMNMQSTPTACLDANA